MKRIVSACLILVFLFQLAGFYVYFCVRIIEIRQQMRRDLAALPDEKLQRITVDVVNFQERWHRDMEMEWKGHMYDIAKIEIQGSVVFVYGLRDEAEDNLISFLQKVMTQTEETGDTSSDLLDFADLDFIKGHQSYEDVSVSQDLNCTPYQHSSSLYKKLPDSPPPWHTAS